MCAEPGEVPCQCNLLVETRAVVSYVAGAMQAHHTGHVTGC
jgi:hypothetical protein